MKIEEVKKLSPLERFLYWVRERESIRWKRRDGESAPWTDDTILLTYRFCNVRRMDDRVSRWLLENWYVPYRDHSNMLAAVAIARFFNLPSSLDRITHRLFITGRGELPDWKAIKSILRELKKSVTIFNGAYMVRGNDGVDKVECVVDHYVRPLVEQTKPKINPDSMEETWKEIRAGYGMGSFMAGQIVADLRWAISGEWEDRKKWAPIGPGSLRGMNRLHDRPVKSPLSQDDFLREIGDVIELVKRKTPPSTWTRLEAMDVQNCLCEYDKYSRALLGEGKPKQLYRMGAS